MKIHLMPLFIPVLFAVVYCEWKYSEKQNQSFFRIESSILNTALGIMERVFDLYFFVALYYCFGFIQSQIGFIEINMYNPFHWIICLFLLDFVIYWFHRSGHQINLLWGAHVAHHQCEEFNLTVAFRNSVFPHIFRSLYMLPLPILGFPAEMIIAALSISGIWQFFIHTKTIKTLNVLEYFMMTPSHHRVHHGSNPEYIDKNFGGMFIIWDKMFGTFQPELAPVKFGITSPLKTWNPIRVYTHVWQDLYKVSRKKNTLVGKLKIWFGSPAGFYGKYKNIDSAKKERRRNKIPRKLIFYIIAQLVIIAGVLIGLLALNEFLSIATQVLLAVFVIGSAINLCLLMETKSNTFRNEKLRIVGMILLPLLFKSWPILVMVIVLIPVSLIWATLAEEKLIQLNPDNHRIKRYHYLNV